MPARKVAAYYAWSRPDEAGAPLDVIESRFPALFESRRIFFPRFEGLREARAKQEVLARHKIDLAAPPHPFTAIGRTAFDTLLQSKPDIFAGTLLVGGATLWSSTAGGRDRLRTFRTNVVRRPRREDRL